MLVDCQTCPVRDVHCAECVVTALTAIPLRPGAMDPGAGQHPHQHSHQHPDERREEALADPTAPLDRAERRAVSALLAAGLVTTATANAARAQLAPVAADPRQRVRRAV